MALPENDQHDTPEQNEKVVRSVEILPGPRVDGTIRPPGSKSLTNRALICAAFASGKSTLSGALRSEDTEVMIEALRRVGVGVQTDDGGRTIRVDGSSRKTASADSDLAELFIGNSGTSVRFLTAALSAAGGHYRLHGVRRMHERPIEDLVAAIEPVIDGQIACESSNGCPPVLIRSNGWQGRKLSVGGAVSSQYLSGLMMAAPLSPTANQPTEITVTGELVSRPYVEMTAKVMASFGAAVEVSQRDDATRFVVSPQAYRGGQYEIEPDASAASYFWAAAAITGGSITVQGLGAGAMQGDVGFCDVLAQMGCDVDDQGDAITVTGRPLVGVDVDMNSISDTVQTLAVVALFAKGPTRVRGVAHNRFKETDRIGDLARELRKLGGEVKEHDDGLTIVPPAGLHGATLETYHDHRMAMALSLAGLKVPGVRILDPACTAKTYPEFFADLQRLTGRAHRWQSTGTDP